MRVFVSGPVSGVDGLNRDAFEEARSRLSAMGCTVLVPHDFVPAGSAWQRAMRRTVETLARADAVACLPGWEGSRGSRVEVQLASGLGIPVVPIGEWPSDVGAMHTMMGLAMRTKICGRCGIALPATMFAREPRSGDGLQAWCSDCLDGYWREHRADRADKRAGEVV